MLSNYLKIAFRNLKKTKLFSLINILGLSIGISSCLLIWHYVNFEKSYDQFHPDSDRIYRLRYERYAEDGSAVKFASCCPPAGKLIRERFPEVEKLGRMFKYSATVSFEDIRFLEERIFFSEPDIFEIFQLNFIEGNPMSSLGQPNNAFISQSTANKYFGNDNPVGKTISLDKNTDYQIIGIFEDTRDNSHIKP